VVLGIDCALHANLASAAADNPCENALGMGGPWDQL